ncbi:MAG: hypothetical protein LUH82_06135 [Clostridiales bacterium]|nr:hypothetical protein [Clostridiales bacterium]
MKYISLIFALNIPCKLETCGDWHACTLDWDNIQMFESEGSLWGDYGIEKDKELAYIEGKYNVANHYAATVDF